MALVVRPDGERMVRLAASKEIAGAVAELLNHEHHVSPDRVSALTALLVAPLELGSDVYKKTLNMAHPLRL